MAVARILNQYAGLAAASDQIRSILGDPEMRRLRALIAFSKGAGVGLIANDLHSFVERGGVAECIIGLDLGGTSPDALQGLLGTGAEVFVFGVRGRRTFHPKVCICDDEGERYVVFIGSSNWTQGGLADNFETGVVVEVEANASIQDDEFIAAVEGLWETYRQPRPPMGSGNLRRVTQQLITRLGDRAAREEAPAPDERRNRRVDDMFSSIEAPTSSRVRARVGGAARAPTHVPVSLPRDLYLDVRGPETGQGREIQVPLESLRDFFGIARDDAYFMTFEHADGTIEVNRPLARYQNKTFRLSSAKFRDIARPAIVHLQRIGNTDRNRFRVRAYLPRTQQYERARRRLNRASRGKDWGIN